MAYIVKTCQIYQVDVTEFKIWFFIDAYISKKNIMTELTELNIISLCFAKLSDIFNDFCNPFGQGGHLIN